MFQDQLFQPLKKLVHTSLGIQEIEKIDIITIFEKYINRFYGYSLLRDDIFLMLAISVIIKKRMKKLKQQLIEAKQSIFSNNIITNNNVGIDPILRKRKVQRQRKEQIVVDNQLIKLPNYLQQNQNSQLAKEESISLPNSQQPSFHSQQLMKIEEEEYEQQPEQIFVQDFRDVLKDRNQVMEMQEENQFQTEVKQTNIQLNLYQQLIEQLQINIDNDNSSCNEDGDTRKNTRKKVKVQMDYGLKKKKIENYKSQFQDVEDEELFLLQKLEAYLIAEYKQEQEDQIQNQDEMLKQIFTCLNDESIQNQLISMISCLNPEEKFMNQSYESHSKSNISVKSVLQSKNLSEDSIKSLRRIQFIEEQQLEEIQEEASNHYNTSLFQEKSIYDKAVHFYHLLCDAAQLKNVIITQENVDRFGPICIQYK